MSLFTSPTFYIATLFILYILVVDVAILQVPRKLKRRRLRARIEARRLRHLELQPIEPVSLEAIMETIGSQSKDVAASMLAAHLRALRERVLEYLPNTSNRVRRCDIQELGNIRQAYQLINQPWPQFVSPEAKTIVEPSQPSQTVEEWRTYIGEEVVPLETQAQETQNMHNVYITIKSWLDTDFNRAEAARLLGQISVAAK